MLRALRSFSTGGKTPSCTPAHGFIQCCGVSLHILPGSACRLGAWSAMCHLLASCEDYCCPATDSTRHAPAAQLTAHLTDSEVHCPLTMGPHRSQLRSACACCSRSEPKGNTTSRRFKYICFRSRSIVSCHAANRGLPLALRVQQSGMECDLACDQCSTMNALISCTLTAPHSPGAAHQVCWRPQRQMQLARS